MNERRVPTPPESLESTSESSLQEREPTPTPPPVDASPHVKAPAKGFVTFTHEVLFADEGPRCDVCGDRLPVDEDDPETALTGSGLYIWSRGGEIVYEEPPLCAVCGTAIGMSAMARWEIEEEEG